MKFSRTSLFRLLAGFVGLVLAPLMLHAQQTLTGTAGQVGVTYPGYTVTSNAAPPLTYGATGLPAGLSINASSGVIAGTPTTAGTFLGTVSVTSGGNTNNAAISITIAAAAGAPAITSATTASGTVNAVFNYTATASNSPTSFNITGLPSGLSANTTSGAISGTPTTVGTYSITLSANNGSGTGAPTTLTLTVAAPAAAPVITSAASASVSVNAAFSYTIAATNTPTSFSASGLPLGLSLNTTSGAITGTPSVAGSYLVTLTATNGSGASAPVTLSLTVGALSSITSATTATGSVGATFAYTVTSTVVVPAVTSFNISGLPAGLTANTSSGAIGGTPITAGTYSVSLSANNATGTGPVTTLALTIGTRPAITSVATAAGTVGTPFNYSIAANNGPITAFAATGLPGGLSVNAGTGLISGTPTVAGTFAVTLTATNSFGIGNATTLTITIASPPSSGGGGGGGVIGSLPAVTANPGDQSVVEGGTATFTVVATGTAPLTYQWRKDLVAISGATSATLTLTGVKLADVGSYSVLISNALGSTASGSAQLMVTALTTPPTITTAPVSQTIPPGNTATFTVVATGASPLTYQWRKNGIVITGATSATLSIPGATVANNGSYTVTVTNALGTITSSSFTLTVDSGVVAPAIATQPVAQVAAIGGNVAFSIVATGTGPLSYQWKKDGVTIAGATAATLALTNVQGPDSGSYSVTITNAAGTVTSNAVTLTVPSSRLANVSVRSGAGTGDQTLIVGLAVGGTGTKQVLVRGIGPGLTQFGLTGALADPQLRLFNAAGVQTNLNEDWGGGATLSAAFSAVGAFSLPTASKDAALLVPLAAGAYTAQVTAISGTGTALLEAYDSDASVTTARFVNISARTQVGTGDNILVIGFVVTGTGSKTVLLRAVGPGLSQFGVGDVLADPQLRLFNAAGVATETNDDWAGTAALTTAFSQTGAFGLPAASKDAALLVTLQPGAYTAQVSGTANTTGVALVEVYEVP